MSPFMRLILIGTGLVVSGLAWGQPSQSRPVRVLMGLPPGAGLEAIARVFADKLRVSLGQPVIVENRVGASGLIAIDALRASPADGSVLLFAPSSSVTLLPQTFKKPRFDPFADVMPIATVAKTEVALAVRTQTPATTVAELINLARTDIDARSFGSAPGTIPHLVAALFAQAAAMEILHVPYKGAGQVITDLLGGQLQASFVTSGAGLPHHRAGKVRILAIGGPERSALLPEVPTLRELGYPIEAMGWFGFFAPAGTPAPTLDAISKTLVEASRAPDVRERLAATGNEAMGREAADTLRAMRNEYEMWRRAIALAGLTLQD